VIFCFKLPQLISLTDILSSSGASLIINLNKYIPSDAISDTYFFNYGFVYNLLFSALFVSLPLALLEYELARITVKKLKIKERIGYV